MVILGRRVAAIGIQKGLNNMQDISHQKLAVMIAHYHAGKKQRTKEPTLKKIQKEFPAFSLDKLRNCLVEYGLRFRE